MWLDVETFDYTYHVNAGEGFKLAIMHHLDQPIMSIRELVRFWIIMSISWICDSAYLINDHPFEICRPKNVGLEFENDFEWMNRKKN